MTKLLVSHDKLKPHLGYEVFLNEERIALIDGNNPEVSAIIPRVLFNLSPFSVWGYSHPDVLMPVLAGDIKPYPMIASKSQAHTLFEHGMKAAWGQVRILRDVPVLTRLDTFYSIIASEKDALELNPQITSMTFFNEAQAGDNALEISFSGNRRVYIANSKKFRNANGSRTIYLDSLNGYSNIDIE